MARDDLTEQRRAEILAAAYRVFAEKGYHGTNIADIAAELRMGHGTFYRYFRNKLDIFSHVIERVIERIGDVVRAEEPEAAGNLEEYRAQTLRIGERLFDLFLEDEHISQLLFYEVLGIDQELNERVQQAMDLFGSLTERYLVNGRERGFLRANLNTRVTAYAINAMIFEGARRILRSPDRQQARQEWMEAVSTLVVRGMAADPPAS